MLAHHRQAHREIRHVERAGDAVDQADTDKKEQRGRQVDRDVVQARAHAEGAAPMQQKAVRGRQRDLEEHEEVKQVAGQKGASQPHEQELEDAVEVRAGPVPARQGEDQRGERQHRHEHQHQ